MASASGISSKYRLGREIAKGGSSFASSYSWMSAWPSRSMRPGLLTVRLLRSLPNTLRFLSVSLRAFRMKFLTAMSSSSLVYRRRATCVLRAIYSSRGRSRLNNRSLSLLPGGGMTCMVCRGEIEGNHAALSRFNSTIRFGSMGRSRTTTPNSESASSTADAIADVTGMVPPSPAPFTPSGFSGVGLSI